MGIVLFFYSNEHEPIHIHGTYAGRETKAEIHFMNGQISKVKLLDRGPGLESKKRREFEDFVNSRCEEIVEKWVDYFVKKKRVSPQLITRKIRNVRSIG